MRLPWVSRSELDAAVAAGLDCARVAHRSQEAIKTALRLRSSHDGHLLIINEQARGILRDALDKTRVNDEPCHYCAGAKTVCAECEEPDCPQAKPCHVCGGAGRAGSGTSIGETE